MDNNEIIKVYSSEVQDLIYNFNPRCIDCYKQDFEREFNPSMLKVNLYTKKGSW